MVKGANRSGARRRVHIRLPSGKSALRFRELKAGKATCPSGRPLPGTASGTAVAMGKLSRTERRPSRPYGGVLSSPALRSLLRERAAGLAVPADRAGRTYEVGSVCMKIAGRDAGQLCVVTEVMDHQFVKVDGFTRPRKVNVQHLEPLGRSVELKKGAKSEDVRKALA